MGWVQTIREYFTTQQQRISRLMFGVHMYNLPPHDVGTTDYEFWRKAKLGQAQGMEMSGLLLKPLGSKITSGVLGKAPTFTLENQVAQDDLAKWWRKNHARIMQAYQDAEDEGDAFIVINPDLSIEVVPPEAVTALVDDNDYSKVIGWTIQQEYPKPDNLNSTMQIRDEYTAKERKRTITVGYTPKESKTYRNVIGKVPIVHIACNKTSRERFGRPIGEALKMLLYRYNEVLEAGLVGNLRQGRPTPTFEEIGTTPDEKEAFENAYIQRVTDPKTGEETAQIQFDSDQVVYLFGNAKFSYKSPQPFAGDSEKLLGLLYYLYLEHEEFPEFVLGNAIQSSNASADAQMPIWEKFIQKKQGLAETWILELCQIVLAYIGAVDIMARNESDIEIEWQPITEENAQTTLDAIKLGREEGIITRETAASKLPLNIKDPQAEVKAAQAEAEADQAKDPQNAIDRAMLDALNQPPPEEDQDETEDEDVEAVA